MEGVIQGLIPGIDHMIKKHEMAPEWMKEE
jgi:hypothetical protein